MTIPLSGVFRVDLNVVFSAVSRGFLSQDVLSRITEAGYTARGDSQQLFDALPLMNKLQFLVVLFPASSEDDFEIFFPGKQKFPPTLHTVAFVDDRQLPINHITFAARDVSVPNLFRSTLLRLHYGFARPSAERVFALFANVQQRRERSTNTSHLFLFIHADSPDDVVELTPVEVIDSFPHLTVINAKHLPSYGDREGLRYNFIS